MNLKHRARPAISAFLLLGAGLYFAVQVSHHWVSVSRHLAQVRMGWLALSFLSVFASYLLEGEGLRRAYTACVGKADEMTYSAGLALVTVSGLFKYLPGKVWPFLYQLERGERAGWNLPALVFANILTTFSVLTGASVVSLSFFIGGYLKTGKGVFAAGAGLALAAALACGVILMIGLKRLEAPLKWVWQFSKIPKQLPVFPNPRRIDLLKIVWVFALSWSCFVLGGAFAALSLSAPVSTGGALLLGASQGVGWSATAAAFVVPGGFGIREGAMYLLLRSICGTEIAIALPLLTRAVMLVCEALLGCIGIVISARMHRRIPLDMPVK